MSSQPLPGSSPTESDGLPSRRLAFPSGSSTVKPSATPRSATFSSTSRIRDREFLQNTTQALGAQQKFTVTPQEHKEAIASHTKQTTRISPHTGQNFEDLELFLQRSNVPTPIDPTSRCGLTWPSTLAKLYTLEKNATNMPTVADIATQLTDLLRSEKSNSAKSYILVLVGYPNSEWFTTIGSLCQVDPEHYQRHLMFSPRQLYFSTPFLPSASKNIVTLRFITIGCRRPKETPQGYIDQLRDDGAQDMKVYKHSPQLNQEHVKTGDSIVRRYSVHYEMYFTIEQEMSISLN